jgi:hypothetical protein
MLQLLGQTGCQIYQIAPGEGLLNVGSSREHRKIYGKGLSKINVFKRVSPGSMVPQSAQNTGP